jgi:trehalose 6-phosphate synthase/phosphatase
MRLFIVSNRLPFTVKEEKGKVQFLESSGGLVTGLSAYLDSLKGSSFTKLEYVWVGWAGTSISQKLENDVRARALQDFDAYPVFIQEKTMDNFYHGFCNRTIWPLFHSFPVYASYEENYWESYEEVNEVFCWEILRILKPEDVLWIHDYPVSVIRDIPAAAQDVARENPGGIAGSRPHRIPYARLRPALPPVRAQDPRV